MAAFISHGVSETDQLGESWGRDATKGLVIALSGDLGAGKTQLVKGLARGLRITARVHSPSFTLVNVYTGGRLTLFHLDLYRLETKEQILSAGIEDYLQPDGVTVIEWAERWFGNEHPTSNIQHPTSNIQHPTSNIQHPTSNLFRAVKIETINETERRISYEDSRD